MDIILLERVGSLGSIGDVVTVKDGYARNYLLPNKKALRANEANRKVFEANRERIESDNAERRGEAQTEATKLDGVSVELIRQASNTGQLYGSVSVRDIVQVLADKGEKVGKQAIVLERPIKAIGVHEVRVQLHAEVEVMVKVNVARSPEEAELQAQGVDVMAEMFEKDEAGFTEDFDPNAEPGEIAAVEPEGESETAETAAEDADAAPAADEDAAMDDQQVDAGGDEDEADQEETSKV